MVAITSSDNPLALDPEIADAAAEIHRNWSKRERRRRCVWAEQQPWTVPQISLSAMHPHENAISSDSA